MLIIVPTITKMKFTRRNSGTSFILIINTTNTTTNENGIQARNIPSSDKAKPTAVEDNNSKRNTTSAVAA
jgi:hypothetical protein